MEEITIENEVRQEQEELIINQEMRNHLLTYAKWGKFFGVLAYIGAFFMLAASVIYMFIDLGNSEFINVFGTSLRFIFIIFFLGFGILYFIGGRIIFQSCDSTKVGIKENNQVEIEKGTKKLASLMSFMGIVTIIGICAYFLFFILVAIGTALVM